MPSLLNYIGNPISVRGKIRLEEATIASRGERFVQKSSTPHYSAHLWLENGVGIQMSETAAITGTQSHDAAKTPEKKNHLAPVSVSLNGEPILLEGLLGSSFGDLATDRHAALLSYPRLSHPANAGLKQQMVSGLQAKYGNVYVQRLLKSQAVQAKLTVNPPDDQYEQEADRVADAMTRAPVSRVQRETEEEELQAEPLSDVQRNKEEEEVQTKPLASSITPLVQRQAEEEEEQKVQAKTVDGPLLQMIQRQAEEEKEEEVQAKSASTNALPSLGDESRTIQRVEAKAQNASGGKPAAKEPGDVGTDLSRETLNGQDGQRELQTKPTQGHVAGETPVSPATREADRLTHQLGTVDPITGRYVFFGEEGHQPIAQESGGLSSHGQAHVVQQAPSLSTAPKGKKAPGSQATPWARPVSSWKEVAEKDQISLPDLLSLAKSSLRLAILLDCVSDVATLSGEPWKPSAKPGTTWKEMPAGSSKDEHYREIDMDRRKKVVDAIANCRSMIKELNASDVGGQAALLPRVQASFYGLLNSASPYYTQMANISLLGKGAWEWTCNVTSLAMTLEALGVTAGDFKGDLGLLSAIAQCLDPGRFKTVADVTSLRMPDLLQLVVIYNQDTGKLLGEHQRGGQGSRPSKPFAGLVTEARNAARPRVSSTLDVFVEVAQQFKGVSVNYSGAGSAGTKELTASAKRTRAVKRLLKTKRRLAQIESQLAKLERQSHGGQARTASKLTEELEKRNSEREQLEGSIGKLSASLPATTSADNVKNYGLWAISTLRPLLDQGKQLVVNRPGHYVRLESVGVDGVLIDDPAFLGKQILLSWEEAYQEGFLRSWVVVSK